MMKIRRRLLRLASIIVLGALSAAEAASAQGAAAKLKVDALALPEDQGAAGLS
ncbi:hypothetical protein [Methylocapsa aurea]|uniref:hypothetical protein n=1 Tax=Methylocapsa aurea TaxID=663610 RepID=UPI0012EB6C1D|nr:hypothetical protein [Methylocapsa aurea]